VEHRRWCEGNNNGLVDHKERNLTIPEFELPFSGAAKDRKLSDDTCSCHPVSVGDDYPDTGGLRPTKGLS